MRHKHYLLAIAILLSLVGLLAGMVVSFYLVPDSMLRDVELTLQGSGKLVDNSSRRESTYDQSELFSPEEKSLYESQGYIVKQVVPDNENTIQLETGPLYLTLDQVDVNADRYGSEAETYLRSVSPLEVTFSLCGKQEAHTCAVVLTHVVTGDTLEAEISFDDKSGKVSVKASKDSGLVAGTYKTKPVTIDIAPR